MDVSLRLAAPRGQGIGRHIQALPRGVRHRVSGIGEEARRPIDHLSHGPLPLLHGLSRVNRTAPEHLLL